MIKIKILQLDNIELVIDNEYIIKNLHYNHIILLYKAKKPDYLTLLFK